MCAGALVNARVSRLVFGCTDPKAGAVDSLYQIVTDPRLNHRLTVTSGVLADDCSRLLSEFFRRRRIEKEAEKAKIRKVVSGRRRDSKSSMATSVGSNPPSPLYTAVSVWIRFVKVAERLKAHAWKACVPQKGTEGSNPSLSALELWYYGSYDDRAW